MSTGGQAIEGTHLLRVPCVRCAEDTLCAPGRQRDAHCAPCWGALTGGGLAGVKEMGYTTPVGYPMGTYVEPEVEVSSYPSPLVSSREGQEPAGGWPGPVAKLAQFAAERGWAVKCQWAKGAMPHGKHGRPQAVRDSYAVRMRRGEFSAVAVYRGGVWGSVWMWGEAMLPNQGSVTKLKEFLDGDPADAQCVLQDRVVGGAVRWGGGGS